jgi:hypothetical protein
VIVDAFIVHVVTEFIGEYPLRHPLKVWRDPSDRISVLRIVTLMCLFAPLSKAIYDSDAIRLDASRNSLRPAGRRSRRRSPTRKLAQRLTRKHAG